MGSASKFSALNTKIQSMRGDLLQQQDYEQLFRLNSTREIAQYLYNNTIYREALKDMNLKEIHRGELEIKIRNYGVSRVHSLSFYLKKEYKDLLKAILFRYEVENVQVILRGLSQKRPIQDIKKTLYDTKSYLNLDYDLLLRSESVDEFILHFQGTILEDAFRNVTKEDVKKREFHIEMNVDYVYFLNLIQKAEKLDKEDRDIVTSIVGAFIDFTNGQWIYRAKKNYKLSDEEILNYTLKGGAKLSFNKMKDMIYSNNFETQFKEFFDKSYRGMLEKDEYIYGQRMMSQYLSKKMKEVSKKHPMSIAPLIEYVRLLEYENLNIVTVVESAKYKEADKWKYMIPTTTEMRKEGR